jgi:ATP-dependent DNA ligase
VRITQPLVGEDWLHKIKHDGYRLILHRVGKRAGTGPFPTSVA